MVLSILNRDTYLHCYTNNHNSIRIDINCLNYYSCLSNKECKGYQYQESKEATCMPIYKNCGSEDGEVFQQSDGAQIYEKGLKLSFMFLDIFLILISTSPISRIHLK